MQTKIFLDGASVVIQPVGGLPINYPQNTIIASIQDSPSAGKLIVLQSITQVEIGSRDNINAFQFFDVLDSAGVPYSLTDANVVLAALNGFLSSAGGGGAIPNPLPISNPLGDISKEVTQLQLLASLQAIQAIQESAINFNTIVWKDGNGDFIFQFTTRSSLGVPSIEFRDMNNNIITPTPPLTPIGEAGKTVLQKTWIALVANVGFYAVHDTLIFAEIIDLASGIIDSQWWYNVNTGSIINPADVNVSDLINDELLDIQIKAFIESVATVLGTIADSPAGTDTGNFTNSAFTKRLQIKLTDLQGLVGKLNEVAPLTDTAPVGINGRLQRIAQRLTSLIALFPAALAGGRLDTNTGAWLGSNAPTVGQKTSADSIPVVLANDQTVLPISSANLSNIDAGIGAITDLQATNATSSWSVIALLKGIWTLLNNLFGRFAAPSTNFFTSVSLATINATSVKASSGNIKYITLSNNSGAVRYFKLYNKASAPSPAADIALLISQIHIPANSSIIVPLPIGGLQCSSGIGFCVTNGIALNDAAAITAATVTISIQYS
jgi:hypothetical protein